MDRSKSLQLLKNAKGQVEAVIKMLENDRYCIDISKQILASISLLKKANVEILNSHLEHCIKQAALSKDPEEINIKIKELEEVLEYLSKIV
ncbi:MAG: metal-sensing transcriptional repressor [Thermosipho sp. (in: Bacteria)]|nr:metal-sensing transcriptional repressor [Thermosipho sp. (in: thermotogales)]